MVKWTRLDRAAAPPANAMAAIRRGAREGTLIDASDDQDFIRLLLRAMHAGDSIVQADAATGSVRRPARSSRCRCRQVDKITVPNREQSNTTVIVDATAVVKIFRKLNEGIHPEIEIGRFLIEHTGFKNVPDLLGSIELVEGDQRSALAVAHRFVENQGDAWTVTGAYLGRFIDDQRVLSAAATPEESPELASYLQPLRQIARRTGELQSALASRPDIAGFRAGADRPAGHRGLDRAPDRAQQSHASICWPRSAASLAEADQALADRMLASSGQRSPSTSGICCRRRSTPSRSAITATSISGRCCSPRTTPSSSTSRASRAARSPSGAAKAPAARDVAGLIRSIDYSTTAALFNAINLTPEERNILDPKLEIWREKADGGILDRLPAGHRSGAVAGRPGRGAEPARFLPARKGVLRNGI